MPDEVPEGPMAPFAALIGDWITESRHVALPGPIPGRSRFEWLPGARFLLLRAETDHPDIPHALSVIGAMAKGRAEQDDTDALSMHYYDTRGVHRVFDVAFDGRILRLESHTPGFAQRASLELSADGT